MEESGILPELNLLNIKQFLHQHFPVCEADKLGENLGIASSDIKTFKHDSGGDSEKLFREVINNWLNNDPSKSWIKLANALDLCKYKVLAEKIRRMSGGRSSQYASMVNNTPKDTAASNSTRICRQNSPQLVVPISGSDRLASHQDIQDLKDMLSAITLDLINKRSTQSSAEHESISIGIQTENKDVTEEVLLKRPMEIKTEHDSVSIAIQTESRDEDGETKSAEQTKIEQAIKFVSTSTQTEMKTTVYLALQKSSESQTEHESVCIGIQTDKDDSQSSESQTEHESVCVGIQTNKGDNKGSHGPIKLKSTIESTCTSTQTLQETGDEKFWLIPRTKSAVHLKSRSSQTKCTFDDNVKLRDYFNSNQTHKKNPAEGEEKEMVFVPASYKDIEELQDMVASLKNALQAATMKPVDELTVMVTGRPSFGKSTLLNNLFGLNLPTRSFHRRTCTMSVQEVTVVHDGIKVKAIDTPGICAMDVSWGRYTLSKYDLKNSFVLIFCLNASEYLKLSINDAKDLKEIKDKCGSEALEHCCIILTFSDVMKPTFPSDREYIEKLKHYASAVQNIFQECNINVEIKTIFDEQESTYVGPVAIPVKLNKSGEPNIMPGILRDDESWTKIVFKEILKRGRRTIRHSSWGDFKKKFVQITN